MDRNTENYVTRPACILRKNPNGKEEFFNDIKKHISEYLDVFVVADNYYLIKEHDSMNKALEEIENQGYLVCFIIDADELLLEEDVIKINEYLLKTPKHAIMVGIIDYVSHREAVQKRDHVPVVAIRTNKRFCSTRCVNGDVEFMKGIDLHHFTIMCDKTKDKLKEHWDAGEIPVLEGLLRRPIQRITVPKIVSDLILKVKGDLCKK